MARLESSSKNGLIGFRGLGGLGFRHTFNVLKESRA